ncbi:GNAT family N-acetyltransferase [Sulfobacillus harzensis]|uniref:GNAT family N-acetyltransferase n=1 Tax=Sulfobacillus harzensis TaxID=2729629 RepID=A0A7Y0Q4W3_9FIRM|nr:GNAT family N-acetyltransferase [Sulfobacillus harzensis]NMP24830.1 GNAT family N-acetyltransferase [Sulfobacillus harzensis]
MTQTVEDTRTFIRSTLTQFGRHDGFQAALLFRGEMAGVVGFDWANRRTSIGCWPFEGRGLMTRAVRAVVTQAFSEYGMNRVEIPANHFVAFRRPDLDLAYGFN